MIKLSKIIFLIISLINACTYGMESAAESEDSVSLKKYHMFCAKKIETGVGRDNSGYSIIIGALLEAYSFDKDSRMLILSDSVDSEIILREGFGVIVYKKKSLSDLLVKVCIPENDEYLKSGFWCASSLILKDIGLVVYAKQRGIDLEGKTQKNDIIIGYFKIMFDQLGVGSSSKNYPSSMDGIGGFDGYSYKQRDYLVSKATKKLSSYIKEKLKIKLCKIILKPDIADIQMLIEFAKYHNLTKVIVCLILGPPEEIIMQDKRMAILALVIDSLIQSKGNIDFVNETKAKLIDAIQHLSPCLDYGKCINSANRTGLALERDLDHLKKLINRGSKWGTFVKKIEVKGSAKASMLEFLVKGLHVLDFLDDKVQSIELPEEIKYSFGLSCENTPEIIPDNIEILILEWLYDNGDFETEVPEELVVVANSEKLLLMNLIEFLGIERARKMHDFQYLIARRFKGQSLQKLFARQNKLIGEIDIIKKQFSSKKCNKLYSKAEKYAGMEESTTSGV